MKHIKVIVMASIFMVCMLLGNGISCAYDPLPNGFRNMQFGDSLQTVQQQYDVTYMSYDKSTNSVSYAYNFAVGDSISGVPLDKTRAILDFWNNQLWSIQINIFKNTSEEMNEIFNTLLNRMEIRFGPAIANKNSYYWANDNSVIFLMKLVQYNGIAIRIGSRLLGEKIMMENARSGW